MLVEVMAVDRMRTIDGRWMVYDCTARPCATSYSALDGRWVELGAVVVRRGWLIRAEVECRSLIGDPQKPTTSLEQR